MSKIKWFNARQKNPFLKWREIIPEEGQEYETFEGEPVFNDKVIIVSTHGEKVVPRAVLLKNYYIQDEENAKKFPIEITSIKSLELIETAKTLEWYAEHAVRNYRAKMDILFDEIAKEHGFDKTKVAMMLDGDPPSLYYMGDMLPSIKDEEDNHDE